MDELQLKLLDMFKWFHEFCEKHGLRYYALGGTMLGAVRHHGFIPWDDDIDVGMPRADYERMQEILADCKGMRYRLESPVTSSDEYFHPFCKLYDTSTTLIENLKYELKRGIYLDIFPLDGIGVSKEDSKRNYRTIYWKHNLLLTRVCGIRQGRRALKNAAIRIMQLIPEKLMNNKKLLFQLIDDCKKYDFDDCSWVGNLVGAWRFKEVMPRDVFGKPVLYDFEGMQCYGPQMGDEYLTYLYGDWRQLPPLEKRVSHHDFVVMDLHKSYLEP